MTSVRLVADVYCEAVTMFKYIMTPMQIMTRNSQGPLPDSKFWFVLYVYQNMQMSYVK